jgi:hypothetical protein
VHPAPDNFGSLELPPLKVIPPFLFLVPTYLSLQLRSAFIGRSVRIRLCLPSYRSFGPFFAHTLFFFGYCVLVTRTLCTVVVGLLLASFSSSPSLVGTSPLRHSPSRGRPRSPRPQPILSRGAAPRRATDSGLAILLWANGRLRPRRSSRLLLGFARVGKTGAGPLSGPRSSRRARDLTMCP